MKIIDFTEECESIAKSDLPVSVLIGFINDNGSEDETEFDIHENNTASVISELSLLFKGFAKENNISADSVLYISWYERNEKYE